MVALEQPTAAPVRYVDEPAFPALRADPDAVAKVVLTDAGGQLHAGARDRRSLVGARALRLPGRRRPGARADRGARRHAPDRGQDQPARALRAARGRGSGAPDAKSRLLRAESADGKVLAEAILGKRQHRLTGNQSAGTYLRRPGEAQSWLASGGVRPRAPRSSIWLDDQIVDLDPERIGRIEIRPDAGAGYVVRRDGGRRAAAARRPRRGRAVKDGRRSGPARRRLRRRCS